MVTGSKLLNFAHPLSTKKKCPKNYIGENKNSGNNF